MENKLYVKRIVIFTLLLLCIWGMSRLLFRISAETVNRIIDVFILLLNVFCLFIIQYIFILFLDIKNKTSVNLSIKNIGLCLVWGLIIHSIFRFFMLPCWLYAFIPLPLFLLFINIHTVKQGILYLIIVPLITFACILSIPFFYWLLLGSITAIMYKKNLWIKRSLCVIIAIVYITMSLTGLFLCHEIEKDDDQHVISIPYYLGADCNFRFFSTPLSGIAKGYLVGPAKFLLQAGADIRFTDDKGRTAFYEASRTGSVEMMRLLLDYGARINGNPQYPESAPVMGALWKNDTSRVLFLIEQGVSLENEIILHSALNSYKDPEILTILLKAGAPVNGQDSFGNTPLHQAIYLHMPIVVLEILLSQGADPLIKNSTGETPMDYAFIMNNKPAIEYLEGYLEGYEEKQKQKEMKK